MWRIFFFFMGVPMMIMSLFEAIDVLPYAVEYDVLVDGKSIEMTIDQKAELKEKIETLFGNCHTMPAFGVVTPEMYEEQINEGTFVSIKFDKEYKLNDLPFDELVFRVCKDCHGFNLIRGQKGIYNGRCVFLSVVDGTMDELYDYLSTFASSKVEASQEEQTVEAPQIEQKEEKISD